MNNFIARTGLVGRWGWKAGGAKQGGGAVGGGVGGEKTLPQKTAESVRVVQLLHVYSRYDDGRLAAGDARTAENTHAGRGVWVDERVI